MWNAPLSQIKQLDWAMCTSGLSAAVATVELEVWEAAEAAHHVFVAGRVMQACS